MSRINTFLELVIRQGGSDLHMVSGLTPRIRIHGRLEPIRFRELSEHEIDRILQEFMTPTQRDRLERDLNVDFAYKVEGMGRFRVNAYRHVHGIAAAFRVIPTEVPSLANAGLPEIIGHNVQTPRGLTLVTGPTGSGKSTTLAAMIDHINATRKGHIITIEDPVEFIHPFKSCSITQREVGPDSPSFHAALRDALREDPDVVLVGEMRDLETKSVSRSECHSGRDLSRSICLLSSRYFVPTPRDSTRTDRNNYTMSLRVVFRRKSVSRSECHSGRDLSKSICLLSSRYFAALNSN
jgi:twitching motility protein PilT